MEERLTNLENLVHALISRIDKDNRYRQYDIDGCRHNDTLNAEGVAEAKAIDGKAYTPTKVYNVGDIVVFGGSFARCLHKCIGIEPTNMIYWELLTVSDMIVELYEKVKGE